ncbi:hypothetical protein D3C76_212320 [compost metagenome]
MMLAMFIIGVLWVTFSLVINASGGLSSKLMFKAFPFFSGCFVALYAAAQLGWVSLG